MPPAMAIQCGAPNDVPPARKQTPHLHPSINLMLNLRLILITVFPFIAVLPLIGFLAPLTLYFLPRQTSHSSAPDMSVRAPIVLPALARHTATVIFIHGLGDTGAGWADAAQLWQSGGRLNDVKFILPHAPQIPITMNGGMHMPGWFDVKNVGSLTQPGAAVDEDEAGVLNSRTYIYSLIQAEIDAGISSDRIIVGGFSQGGAMSILSGLTAPYKLGGVVGLSSWLLLNSKFESLVPKDSQNKATKIFMGHGSADPLVRYPMGKASEEKLKGLGYDVTFKTYPGMQHSACMEEFKDVEEFIHGRLN